MDDATAPRSLDSTLHPGETIRSESRAEVPALRLPELSVDLAARSGPAGEPRSDLEVRGVIGEGGMGRVLVARQHSLARDVAVKTARPDAPESARAAILDEGAITGQLEHPAIVPVHALGLDAAGRPAMVMKRIEGVSWDALLEDPSHAGWEGWEGTPQDRLPGHLQILTAVCNALHFAHSRGVVHRDVKPQNVLIGRYADVYLADWGVAGELGARAQGLCGTPAYLAPEMVSQAVVDARTDVYLLGATLHAVLTGQPRHPGATVTESLVHARTSPPFAYGPQVAPELADLANRACHLDPAQRPRDARAFRDELAAYLRHRDAVALAQKAQARLAEAEPLLAQPEVDLGQLERLERLLAEARFGLEQSLERCGQLPAARAALARVQAIDEERRRHAIALETESRERDPRRGVGGRTLGMGVVTLVTIVASLPTFWMEGELSPAALLGFPAALLGVILAGGPILRPWVMTSGFNRQGYWGLVMGLAFLVLGRALGLAHDLSSAAHFTRDLLLLSAMQAVYAHAFLRWMWFGSAMFAAAAISCAFFPQWGLALFCWSSVAAMAMFTYASWRDGRRAGVR